MAERSHRSCSMVLVGGLPLPKRKGCVPLGKDRNAGLVNKQLGKGTGRRLRLRAGSQGSGHVIDPKLSPS